MRLGVFVSPSLHRAMALDHQRFRELEFLKFMAVEIKLPELGEGIESGDVIALLVKEGDVLAANQAILELETDKATVEVPSPHAGRVGKVHVAEGQTVPIGATLVTLETSETPAPAAQSPAPPPKPPAPHSHKHHSRQRQPRLPKWNRRRQLLRRWRRPQKRLSRPMMTATLPTRRPARRRGASHASWGSI